MSEKELIGKICLSTGQIVEVRMPTMGEVLSADPRNLLGHLVQAATGLTPQEFSELPAPDGYLILGKLNTTFKAMQEYNNVINQTFDLNQKDKK